MKNRDNFLLAALIAFVFTVLILLAAFLDSFIIDSAVLAFAGVGSGMGLIAFAGLKLYFSQADTSASDKQKVAFLFLLAGCVVVASLFSMFAPSSALYQNSSWVFGSFAQKPSFLQVLTMGFLAGAFSYAILKTLDVSVR